MPKSPKTTKHQFVMEESFGNALKSLHLGMSGSQADFIFDWVKHILEADHKAIRQEIKKRIEKKLSELVYPDRKLWVKIKSDILNSL
jgi:LEA14-like dessication related protein